MNIKEALQWATKYLRKRKFHITELDAEVLLAHVLGKDRVFLFSHPEQKISSQKFSRFKKMVQRRAKREPVAYIVGYKYFYNLKFSVNKKTLIPRPESELLVDLGLKYLKKNNRKKITVIDIGTGSGAIITALANNFPKAKFIGTDNSAPALAAAKKNARANKVKVEFFKSDLLKNFSKKFWQKNLHLLLVANLPYLPTRVWQESMPEVKKYEPRAALDGGSDGLDYYRRLAGQLKDVLPHLKSFQAYWEIDPAQPQKLKKLLKEIGAKRIRTYKDLCGRNRVVGWRK